MPKVAQFVSPYDFIINQATNTLYRKPVLSTIQFDSLYKDLQSQIRQHHPHISAASDSPTKNLTAFLDDRGSHLVAINPPQEEQSLEMRMKALFNEQYHDFVSFAVATVSNFDISQSAYQNVLRNNIGRKLEDVIGINVFVPKNDMIERLNAIKSSLKNVYDLKYVTYNDTMHMAAFINIKNAIEHLLSKQNMQEAVKTPNDALLVYYYCDAFPWMGWSKFFSGETSIRIKIVEPYNMLSTAFTVCSFLGPDNYEMISNLCQEIFEQLATLEQVMHPLRGCNIKVYVRGLGDGANRRTITGSSTAKSTFPIEEAPEHQRQLGDMTVYCPEPLRTFVKDEETDDEESSEPCFCTIQVHLGKNKTPPDYHELFKLDEKLNAALRAGIKENYPEFTVCESRPEDVLPIVKDPELVRAAQLLVVDFACDEKATDIPWLIRQYSAVYKSFKRLLRSRLENQSSGSHEE